MSPFWQPRKPLDWTIRCSRTLSTLLPGAHTWSADSPPPPTKRSGLQMMRGVFVVNLLQIESISKLPQQDSIGPDFYFIILEKPQRLSLLPPPSLSISLVDSTTTLPTSKASSGWQRGPSTPCTTQLLLQVQPTPLVALTKPLPEQIDHPFPTRWECCVADLKLPATSRLLEMNS